MSDLTPEPETAKSAGTESVAQTESASEATQRAAQAAIPEPSQDAKNLAVLTWVGTIFLGFLPGLILYLVKKDDAYVQDQSKEALNWSITVLFAYCIAMVLSLVLIGLFLFPIVGVIHLVFCILGIVGTQKGEQFRVPYAVRLIK